MRRESDYNKRRHVKSTRPFRLSIAALFELVTSARLIQPTQLPLVGIVTHGPFVVAHMHSSKATQLPYSVSKQRFGTHVSGVHCSVHLFNLFKLQFPHPLELLVTRVPSDQRALMQRCELGASSDQRHSGCLLRRSHCNCTQDPSTRSGSLKISCPT